MGKTILASLGKSLLGTSAGAIFLSYGSLAYSVEPRQYQLGDGGTIAPHLNVEIGTDSNPLRQDQGSDASVFLRLEPSVEYRVQQRNNRLTFGYAGDFLQYIEEYCVEPRDADCQIGESQSDRASFQDHIFDVTGELEASRKLRFNAVLRREIQNQPLGTGLSANAGVLSTLTEPDTFRTTTLRAEGSYGARQARGELRFGLTYRDRDFDRIDGLSEETFEPTGSVFYRIGTKTQLFAGLSQSNVTGGNTERDISRQFVGVTVDASAITSGTFRLINVTEDFDNSNRTDLDFIAWELEVEWKPRRFSTVTISGGRETTRGLFNLDDPTIETTGQDIGIATDITVDWRHFWRDRFSTDVGLRFSQDEGIEGDTTSFLGQDALDTTTSVRLEGNYNLRRWLDVGAFVVSESRDGETDNRDFDRTQVGITANGTF